MTDPLAVAAAAFIFVAVLVLLLATVAGRRPEEVRRRLGNHAVAVESERARRLERINVLKKRNFSTMSGTNSLLSGLRPTATATFELERAGISTTVARYLLLRALAGALLFAVAQGVANTILISLGTAVIGIVFPRMWLRRRGRKRLAAFEAQLAESIDLLVGALRAGHGFLQGLESVSKQMDSPTREELSKVIDEVNVGISPVDALQALAGRMPSYDLSLLVSAISVQRQTGGNLAEVLENLAATVRERRRVRGEVLALTTGPRVSSYVLAAIPVLLFAYFVAISPEYRDVMLGTTYGHMLLGLATVLSMLGFVFTRKVSKVEY